MVIKLNAANVIKIAHSVLMVRDVHYAKVGFIWIRIFIVCHVIKDVDIVMTWGGVWFAMTVTH